MPLSIVTTASQNVQWTWTRLHPSWSSVFYPADPQLAV